MIFKKFHGQIFDVELSKKEQRAMDEHINRQITERHREFTDDFDYMVMKILHDHFGFGPVRLRRFYDLFIKDNEALIERYEMTDAGVYIARKEMNAIGCNIEKWNQERSE
jgi:hypothetical protein